MLIRTGCLGATKGCLTQGPSIGDNPVMVTGLGLDVFVEEPKVPEALRALENVVLLPHLGSATRATREAMGMKCVANLAAFFAGEALPDPVV